MINNEITHTHAKKIREIAFFRMNNEQLTSYLQDESYLYTLSYEEIKTLVVQYPYAANLRILLLKKAHLEQSRDFDRNLNMAAIYSTNRRFLYKLVKKLKSLQAVPENVILAEDYLELTELSNIEKILSIRQVSEAYATHEKPHTLSADFSLNFEPPTRTQEDDDALFGLSSSSIDTPNFDIMSDEEVDFLVDDIVSKFKNPMSNGQDFEKKKEEFLIIEKDKTVVKDFQAVFTSNTEGDISLDSHDSDLNTHFFDENDDPEWAINTTNDTAIEEEISKLHIFNQPLKDEIETSESVSHVENLEDFSPIETSESISHVENLEDFSPIETTQTVLHIENVEDFSPIETTQTVSHIENVEDFSPIETTKTVSHVENLEDFSSIETTQTVSYVEDFQPIESPFMDYIVNENVSSEIQDLYYTSFLPALVEPEQTAENKGEPLLSFIEDAVESMNSPNESPIYGFIENMVDNQPILRETPMYNVIENFTKTRTPEEPVSKTTPLYNTVEDFKETEQSLETQDLTIKKKDNIKPLIELEIVNQSKTTIVEHETPQTASNPQASFSEWLQQFEKPSPTHTSITDRLEKEALQPLQHLDNQPTTPKSRRRTLSINLLNEIFESPPVLPDNLFNLKEPHPDDNAILNDFLNETIAVSNDNDMEWLNMPIENTTLQEEAEEGFQQETPQKKKRKKIMHELAAQSLVQDNELISEPLADIFAAQGLKDKAIEMYQRLSLQIPEKSDFFAAKIEKLRTIP